MKFVIAINFIRYELYTRTILSDFSNKKESGCETILKTALKSLIRSERKGFEYFHYRCVKWI